MLGSIKEILEQVSYETHCYLLIFPTADEINENLKRPVQRNSFTNA